MEHRIDKFVKAMAFNDQLGKVCFNIKEQRFDVGIDHLISLPLKGSVSLECDVRDDTIEVEYFLEQAHKSDLHDKLYMTATYKFKVEGD